MMKRIIVLLACAKMCCALFANEAGVGASSEAVEKSPDFQNHLIPNVSLTVVQTDDKDYLFNPSGGVQFMRIKTGQVDSWQPDFFSVNANYGQYKFTQGIGSDKDKNFYEFDLTGNAVWGKNTFVAIFGSGGYVNDFKAALLTGAFIYNRQFIKTKHVTFEAGCGISIGDTGEKIEGVEIWAMPVITLGLKFDSEYFQAYTGFMGAPVLNFTVMPNSIVRLKASASLTGTDSIRDVVFDAAVVCSPFKYTKLGENITVSSGLMHSKSKVAYDVKEKYGIHYFTAYGEIDAKLLTLRAGYNFGGEWIHKKDVTGDMKNGLFASASVKYCF